MSDREFALFVPCAMWTVNKERTMHHHARAKLVKPAREMSKLLTLQAMRQRVIQPYSVPVHVEFFPTQPKAGSLADTASHLGPCKAVLDGVVDAKLLIDDTPQYVMSQRFWPPIKGPVPGVGIMITTQAVSFPS